MAWDISVVLFSLVLGGVCLWRYRHLERLLKVAIGGVNRINLWYDRWDIGWYHCKLILDELTKLVKLSGQDYVSHRDEVLPMALVGLPNLFVGQAKYRAAILQEGDDGLLRIVWAYNFEPQHKMELVFDRESIPGRTLRSGRSQYVPDVQADPLYQNQLEKYLSYPALYSVPLVVQDRPRAVLNIHGSERDCLLLEDRIWVDLVGRIIGLCLELDRAKAS